MSLGVLDPGALDKAGHRWNLPSLVSRARNKRVQPD